MKRAMMALCSVALMSGCANMTSEKIDSYGEIAKAYYNHDDSTSCIRVVGTATNPATFCMSGVEIEIRMPTQPKTIIPREPSAWSSAGDTIKTIFPWLTVGYLAHTGVLGGGDTTTTYNSTTSTSATP